MRPGRFGDYLAALGAAHNLADHVVQTDHQAARKAVDWRAMAGHVGGYQAVQLGALLALSRATGARPTWGRMVAAGAFSALSHAFLDRRWPVRRALELTRSPYFARPPTVQVQPTIVRRGAFEAELWTTAPPAIPVPLHGPYLADQALHHACLAVCAAILAGGRG